MYLIVHIIQTQITYVALAVQCTYIQFPVALIMVSPHVKPFKLSKEK